MSENRVQKFFNAALSVTKSKKFTDMPPVGRIEGDAIPEAMNKLLSKVCSFLLADGEVEIRMGQSTHKSDGRERLTLEITINGKPADVSGLVRFIENGGGDAG